MEKHYMIDIETTGVNQETDDILEIGLVEIVRRKAAGGFWWTTGRTFHRFLHTKKEPVSEFAKKHQKDLFKTCQELDESENYEKIAGELREFIHEEYEEVSPRYFMGWNASNFDMPFVFKRGLLTPSYYEPVNGKEVLKGDAHYRIYEQTGSVQVLSDITGLSRETVLKIAEELDPTQLNLPKGKAHDALYDCYKQIKMQNGLIELGRRGFYK